MSRITGSDAQGLIKAYNAVYASQELTEEQIWEEVENWVNSLLEEGHDLSEYTWEDMYEEYLNEMGQPGGNRPGGNRPISNAPYQSRFARPMNAGTVSQGTRRGAAPSRVVRPQIGGLGGLGAGYRGAELQQAAAARASQVGTTRQGTAGGPTVGGNTPAPTRPAPAPAPTPAKPVATAPAAVSQVQSQKPTTAPAASSIERRTPTSAELRQAQQLRTSGSNLTGAGALAPSKTLSTASRNLSGTGALATRPATPAPAAAPKPNLQQQIRQRRLNMDFDPFDIVQGYLIDEGYAETEEAAAVIMANMNEEWREEIIEYYVTEANRADDYVTSSMFMSREPETKNAKKRRRRMRDRLSDQDDNLRQFAHTLSRGDKRRKGKKPLDEPGKNRYSTMQHDKKQAQRERDADEQRSRDRDGMSRGTWDKG